MLVGLINRGEMYCLWMKADFVYSSIQGADTSEMNLELPIFRH